jgi:GNAT superfamily N-acetyltransferase
MAGVAVLRFRLVPETAQLFALYVDREHRRTGVATALVEEVERLARKDGARLLYVSATPSDSAVRFYLRRGFRPVERPHPGLLELEPEDIHMSKALEGSGGVTRPSLQSSP